MFIKIGIIAFSFSVNSFVLAAEGPAAQWQHESELGISLVGGNSKSQSENIKHSSKVNFTKNTIQFTGDYLHNSSNEVTSAENWRFKVNYERTLTMRVSSYASVGMEQDRFAGFENRTNFGLGGKYYFIKEKSAQFFTELGLQRSEERRVPGSDPLNVTIDNIRAYLEYEKKWDDRVSGKLWVEGLPSLTDSEDLRANYEASVKVTLNKTLALKTSYLTKFDNQPAVATNEKTDWTFLTSLLAQY